MVECQCESHTSLSAADARRKFKRRRLALVLPSLSAGGAERVAVQLTRELTRRNYACTLVTLAGEDEDFYHIPDEANRIALNVAGITKGFSEKVFANLGRLRTLRQAVIAIQPDWVVSFMTEMNVLCALACRRLGSVHIATEHSFPQSRQTPAVWKLLQRITYTRLARLVCVSGTQSRCFAWLPRWQRTVIYNPIDLAELRRVRPSNTANKEKLIVAVGRLNKVKGFDVLIRALTLIRRKLEDWKVIIAGDGPERENLGKLLEELELGRLVTLAGPTENSHRLLWSASIFVCPSRWEAFGLAAVEAAACQCAVVASGWPNGTAEIFTHGKNALLVPPNNTEQLANAIATLVDAAAFRHKLGEAAAKLAKRFDLPRITDRWEQLLKQTSNT